MEELQRENPSLNMPDWIEDKKIHEVRFCNAFLAQHPMVCINGTFFTKEGRVTDENRLRKEILDWMIEGCKAILEGRTENDLPYEYFGGVCRQHPISGTPGEVIVYNEGK